MSMGAASLARRMRTWVAGEHFRYRCRPDARLSRSEVDLSTGVVLDIDCASSSLIDQMRRDFSTFLRQCLRVPVRRNGHGPGTIISFNLHEPHSPAQGESFTIVIAAERIIITAPGERGLLHATHYLERRMAIRGGPFLSRGRIHKQRLLDPYISDPVFPDGPNFSLMSHFGVNGMLFPMQLWNYCRNKALPDLNTPDYIRKIAALRQQCRAAAAYGIDLYLDLNHWGGLPENAPLFIHRPDVRGAEFYYSKELRQFFPCCSHPDVLRCYNEAFENIFRDVPELGGASLIVGCEGFMHCFSFPKPPVSEGTNCPHCRGKNIAGVVATMVNGISQAVRRANPQARVFVWPYSAHFWSGKDVAQTELIRHLKPPACFLSDFDTPYLYRLNGAESWVIDYNIRNLGPSRSFTAQSRALARRRMPHYAKTESSTSVFFFSIPYIPVPYRWFERYRRLRAQGVPGIIGKWHFYGLTGSLPEELLCATVWENNPRVDRLLAEAARRDFGAVDLPLLLRGWQQLSRAWELIPISHLLFGERHGYMKGPFWLGPAHPLIFDVQRDYRLSRKFAKQDPGKIFPGVVSQDQPPQAPHKYSSDLLFTFPFTPLAVEQALNRAIGAWEQGLAMLAQALGRAPAPRAVMELDICRTVAVILRSARNVVRFYRVRDAFFSGKGSLAVLRRRVQTLRRIADEEIANAESLLPVLERDPRIGFTTDGQVFDAAMIAEKVRQCRYVRDIELPELARHILKWVYCKSPFAEISSSEDCAGRRPEGLAPECAAAKR